MTLFVTFSVWMHDLRAALKRKLELPARKREKRSFVRLRGPESLEERYAPATDLWIGAAGGLWSAAANWHTNQVPQAGDTLQFGGSVGGVNGTVTTSTDDIGGLDLGGLIIQNNFNQTITLGQTLMVTGSLNVQNGTPATATIAGNRSLTVTNTGGQSNLGGGTISTAFNFRAGTLTINGSDVALTGISDNDGTINWSSANPQQGAGPNIDLGANGFFVNSGTFNINVVNTEKITGRGARFTNYGTMQKTGASPTNIEPDFSNGDGTLTINSGTLGFQNLARIAGGGVVLNGGNLTSFTQTISLLFGGALSGVGTINGDVDNQSGTITPGVSSVPGSLKIVGSYTQENNGTLVINIDGTGNIGLLTIGDGGTGGDATLAGTLQVNRNGPYEPPVGTDLIFMFYRQLEGNFQTINFSNNVWPGEGESTNSFVAGPEPVTSSYDLVVQSNP